MRFVGGLWPDLEDNFPGSQKHQHDVDYEFPGKDAVLDIFINWTQNQVVLKSLSGLVAGFLKHHSLTKSLSEAFIITLFCSLTQLELVLVILEIHRELLFVRAIISCKHLLLCVLCLSR